MILAHADLVIDFFAVLGALIALWKGNIAERAAAVAVIVNVLISELSGLAHPDASGVIRLVNDGLTALILLVVTIRYSALWMGGVMLFFAAQFSLFSFYMVTERRPDFWHAWINDIDFSGVVWCLVIGTVVAWRKRLRLAREAAAQPAAV